MSDRIHHYLSYDGETELPEEGVADFHGEPHYFWLREERLEPRTGLFDLAPVDADLLGWVTELETIWHEWDLAYHAGEVELATHPRLPGNNLRFKELLARIEQRAVVLRSTSISVVGTVITSPEYLDEMRPLSGRKWPVPGSYSPVLMIMWSEAR